MPTRHTSCIRSLFIVAGLALAASSVAPMARADEGMWLLTKPPLEQLKTRYQFAPTPQWLEHAQKSAVRFNVGGSGSLVSKDGLVMTNHHVASDSLAKLSSKERDLLVTGFLAAGRADEIKCPDLELDILWNIKDITAEIAAAVPANASIADAGKARRQAIAAIEKSATESSGLQSEVVTLYNGGQYHLYQYRRYTDVRLVFAPEQSIAFFGGDTDNFEYPRFNLDVTFFRIYENDKPLNPEHFFSWSAGAKDNDLAIVVGHPGSTRRGYTVDHARHMRDVEMPRRLANLWRFENKLQTFAARSAEHRRVSGDDLFGVANGRKASTGIMAGLADPGIMAAKEAVEQQLFSSISQSMAPDKAKETLAAFDAISRSRIIASELGPRNRILQNPIGGQYGSFAVDIVRLAAELPKPSSERLREYGDARLSSLYQSLYSPAPLYDFYEIFRVEQQLLRAVEVLGGEDPLVRTLLAGKSPAVRAEELVKGCTFKTPEARKKLVEGGSAALAAAMESDPMLALVAKVDQEARATRKRFEDEVDSVERDAYSKIAAARFAALGDSVYPDATFTLRLSFGPIKGYEEAGQTIPAFTTIAGLYARYAERKGQEGFELPDSWLKAKDKLALDTPFNFVCTADIIGGNSGSPVINTKGQVTGLIFDGNLDSLIADIQYPGEARGRALAVDSRAILHALTTVYPGEHIAAELLGR